MCPSTKIKSSSSKLLTHLTVCMALLCECQGDRIHGYFSSGDHRAVPFGPPMRAMGYGSRGPFTGRGRCSDRKLNLEVSLRMEKRPCHFMFGLWGDWDILPTSSGEDDICHIAGNQGPNKMETHTSLLLTHKIIELQVTTCVYFLFSYPSVTVFWLNC